MKDREAWHIAGHGVADSYNLETEQHQGLFITDCLCSATQLCLTLCNSMDCSPPDTSVHGIFQARILEQVAISYSRGKELFGSTIFSKSVKVLVTQSCPTLCDPTECSPPLPPNNEAPLSMEFSRQEYWSGCHSLLQGIFPTQGLN